MGPPPGYPINGPVSPDFRSGQPPHYGGPLMNGYPMQGPQPPAFSGPLPTNPPLTSQGSSYSSPYAPKQASNSTTQNPSTAAPDHNALSSGPHPSGALQQARLNYQQLPLQPNESIARALDTFKTALIASLKGKSNNAEAVVTSAINRVLGITSQSTVPGDQNEEKIMAAAKAMLSKLPGANLSAQLPHPPHPQQQQSSQKPSQTPSSFSNESSTSAHPTANSPNIAMPSAPSIARPPIGPSQSRPNGTSASVPRPPMMTPGMTRTSSGSPANAQARLGGTVKSSTPPAHAPAPPVASSVNHNPPHKPDMNDNGKRTLEEPGDAAGREFKRLNTAGPPPLKA